MDDVSKNKMQFENKQEFVAYLTNFFQEINQVDEFELFAHQVNDWYTGLNSSPKDKMMSILNYGLNASKYGSADGTLNNLGSSMQAETIDKILDYDYHSRKKQAKFNSFPTVVLAFPKTVVCNGEQVCFTRSKFSRDNADWQAQLKKLQASKWFETDSQYVPKTWLDIVYGFKDYSVSDNLFAFYLDENGKYTVFVPKTHRLYGGKLNYDEHKKQLASKIEKYNADLGQAIVKKSEQTQAYLDDYLNEI